MGKIKAALILKFRFKIKSCDTTERLSKCGTPARIPPPMHLHGMEAEFCYVVSGQFNFKLGERIVSAPAGAFVFIPRNTAHTFQNIGTELGVLLFGVTPGGFEKIFAERQGVDADTNQKLRAKHHMQVVGPPLR